MLKYFKSRSVGYILKFIAVSPLALLTWLAIEITNLFRPVFVVGLSYKGRITHYMTPMELHLRNANRMHKEYIMIFVMPAATPNYSVRKLYRRSSIIIDSECPDFIRRIFAILAETLQSRFTPKLVDYHELWLLKPATSLSESELKFGEKLFEQLGIPNGAQYVCMGVKDGAYYASITLNAGYGQDLRDQVIDSKNVDIEDYLLAATHLANQGIYVVRVGSVVGAPLPKDRHPRIIDYAITNRTELGDIVLGANCKFFILGCTGSFVFAASNNRPIVYTNHYFENHHRSYWRRLDQVPNSILIPRMYQFKNGNFLSFKSIIEQNTQLLTDHNLEALKISPIANSPEEILDAVVEMNSRLDGTYVTSVIGDSLQDISYSNFDPPIPWRNYPLMRIGDSFVTKYKHLFRTLDT